MDIDDLGLRIVSIDTVVPHEIEDPRRVERLCSHLRKEGWLRNPPLVVEKDATYVILDGTTRTHAMRKLGYHHILVQVVDLITCVWIPGITWCRA
jgi:ParB-like chromosome segregation protein Spo0J